MKSLVLGASGATGREVVEQLLLLNQPVKVLVRRPENVPESWKDHKNLNLVSTNISEISQEDMVAFLKDCQAVISCLGHNLTFKGIYGKPRKLVTNAVRLVYEAIQKNQSKQVTKLVLMNTAGNSNRDLNEKVTLGEKLIIGLLRIVLPPHPDNEKAADFLRLNIGQNHPRIEWVAVRPDSLVNHDKVSRYHLHESPTRSALFNPGKTSRINVGHFMADLVTNQASWDQWKGRMPVIYNED
ncbi:MAG: NAD(P)-dependent oxidoreductase [Candidatus Cyclobacteriaceae bacterium M3_2C_046]